MLVAPLCLYSVSYLTFQDCHAGVFTCVLMECAAAVEEAVQPVLKHSPWQDSMDCLPRVGVVFWPLFQVGTIVSIVM